MEFLILSWKDIENLTRKLAMKIKNSGFSPEVLIAIGRGGYIPARLLSDYLPNHNLVSIRATYYKGIAKTQKEVKVISPSNLSLEGKRVLLVDDVSDTGESLNAVKEKVMEKGPKDLRIATIHMKPHTKVLPDFYVEKTESWIIYPWEKMETLRNSKDVPLSEKDKRFFEDLKFNSV